jgi:hypothetical protein
MSAKYLKIVTNILNILQLIFKLYVISLHVLTKIRLIYIQEPAGLSMLSFIEFSGFTFSYMQPKPYCMNLV